MLNFFLRSPQNHRFCCNRIKILTHRKTKNPRSKKFRHIKFMETFNIDLHPPGTPKPFKNSFLLQQNWFFGGFGVPGGCKSILNVKCLHKSYMAELFGPRVFCFSVGQNVFFFLRFGHFCPDLKHNFNIYLSKLLKT